MNTAIQRQSPPDRAGFERAQRGGHQLRADVTASPSELLLPRLDGVITSGKGWRAQCPSCGGKSKKLAIAEGDDGRLLLTCFAGCPAHDVVAAVGLTVADLFVRRDFRTLTRAERSELRQRALIPKWRAALEVVVHEATVVQIAACKLSDGTPLTQAEHCRMGKAACRIFEAKEVLDVR